MSSIKNVAIIMDGNGRWAKDRKRPRVWGHVRGSFKVTEIVKEAVSLGLESLTLYSFSTENWSRPKEEVKNLFKLLKKFLNREKETLKKNNIRFNVIGNYKVIDSEVVALIDELIEETKNNSGLLLSLAINYGGRSEIIDAINDFMRTNPSREITEEEFQKYLYCDEINNIDLLIRTAGDRRISNFLLWQLCYSEFYFTDKKWPDFSKIDLKSIIEEVSGRDRRFGSIENSVSLNQTLKMAQRNKKVLS